MLIDWFTVVAQVINFLILVWLLKRFLYKPILDTIDERERKVIQKLSDADARMKEAGKEREEYSQKNKELDQHRAESMGKAERDADAERQRLLDQARKEYEEKRANYSDILMHEEDRLMKALSSRTRKEVFAIARKTLADMADAEIEKSMVDVFLKRLDKLSQEDKDQMAASFQSSSEPVLIRTEMDMPADQKASLEHAIADMLKASPQYRYETAPDLIGGIEVTVSGKKVAWSIKEYLSKLESDVHEILKHQPGEPASGQELNVERGGVQQQTGAAENGK